MTIEYLGNIRGPRGLEGPQGRPGLPGMNAVPTDEGVAQLVNADDSATGVATRDLYDWRDTFRPRGLLTYKTHVSGARYSVLRVKTGRFVPGLVEKEFALDYQDEGTSGVDFKPVRENLDAAQRRLGSPVLSNASGWKISGNIGEMRGAQIRHGVKYHDMALGHPQECDALGIMPDGRFKLYSARWGDTTQTMLDEGVWNSFVWGPALVIDGVVQDITTDPLYAGLSAQISARLILGQSVVGDVILIQVEGVTDVEGMLGSQMAALAAAEGCHQAIALDGGGSTQLLVGSTYAQPSSDASARRPLPDFVVINAAVEAGVDTGWIPLPLEPGYTEDTVAPAIKQVGDTVMLTGRVKPVSGVFGTSSETFAYLPRRFRRPLASMVFRAAGNGETTRKLTVNPTSGQMQVYGESGSDPASYVGLDTANWFIE